MKKKLNILLVEDEGVAAMLIERQLKSIGHAVANHVTTGESAIESVRKCKPCVILMDIRLKGGIDGIETATSIKNEMDIPIVFITGFEHRNVREKAEKLNPLGFLIKPIDVAQLKAILDNCRSTTIP